MKHHILRTSPTRLAAAFLVAAAVLAALVSFTTLSFADEQAHATLSPAALRTFEQQVTLDVESSVAVALSPEDRAGLHTEADMSALQWLVKTLAIESARLQGAEDDVALPTGDDSNEIADALAQERWYDTFDTRETNVPISVRELVLELRTYGAASLLLSADEDEKLELLRTAASAGLYDNPDPTADDVARVSAVLRGKVEEIYTANVSAELSRRLASTLPLGVALSVEAPNADGSEDAALGIDGSSVLRGFAEEPITFSRVDFGAEGQLYDQVLADGLEAFAKGAAKDAVLGEQVLADNRSVADHFVAVDKAAAPDVEIKESRWDRYGTPTSPYLRLVLDEGMPVEVGAPTADLLVSATFDKKGRVLSLGKPLAMPVDYDRLCANDAFLTLDAGTYRYKLVVSDIDARDSLAEEPVELAEGSAVLDLSVAVGEDDNRSVSARVLFLDNDAAGGQSTPANARSKTSGTGVFAITVGTPDAEEPEEDETQGSAVDDLAVAIYLATNGGSASSDASSQPDAPPSNDEEGATDASTDQNAPESDETIVTVAPEHTNGSASGALESESAPAQTSAAQEEAASPVLPASPAQDQAEPAQSDPEPVQVQAPARPQTATEITNSVVRALTVRTGDAVLAAAFCAVLLGFAGLLFAASGRLHRRLR